MTGTTEPVRLAKRVAELMGCSRSEAERYIEGGWVTVNGTVIDQRVSIHGRMVRIPLRSRNYPFKVSLTKLEFIPFDGRILEI